MNYELPASIRLSVEGIALERVGVSALRDAAEAVSMRYRREDMGGSSGGGLQIKTEAEALAYLVARMPATYAANARVLAEVERLLPDFSPQSVLDIGAGPGTASVAVGQAYSSIKSINLVEPNRFLQSIGKDVLSPYLVGADWQTDRVESFVPKIQYDLVLASYVLNETPLDKVHKLVEKIWTSCCGVMIILEPGTPQGAGIIQKIRDFAVQADNTYLLAPCPHDGGCPLVNQETRWCHFSVRTSRTKLHKTLKSGDAGFEDEKFSYVILSRFPASRSAYRLMGHPSGSKLREMQVCGPQGTETLQVSKSHPLHKLSKKLDWGDGFDI